ncbi:MAG TPA: hypothetical protein VFI25_07450 [Planctomycetota bacterium]|jgi:hypothetical protein|nr:hypothetical protein [Planctomycetota bacterium]
MTVPLPSPRLPRREFLRLTGATIGAAAVAGTGVLSGAVPVAAPKTRRVVLVAFAGGVRSREILDPTIAPNLARLAAAGVVYPETVARNVGHYGAALSIYSGCVEVAGIRENLRGTNPTIFEYVRRGTGIPATQVWLSTTGGEQQVNYAFSDHPRYGSAFGANLVSGEGIFNPEFRGVLEKFGRLPAPDEPREDRLKRLRAAVEPPERVRSVAPNDPESAAAVARYLLDELSAGTSRLTGPGAADAKAFRVGSNVLRIFKPRLLGVSLIQADVAHSSYNDYVEVIRRNDAELGRLIDGIAADPELRETTAVFVLPEFGRDRDLNPRRGLDHGDASEDLLRIALVASGPDFRKGKIVKDAVESIDVCPTIAKIFGVPAESARGKVLKGLLA